MTAASRRGQAGKNGGKFVELYCCCHVTCFSGSAATEIWRYCHCSNVRRKAVIIPLN